MRSAARALAAPLALCLSVAACQDRRPSDEVLTPGPERQVAPSDDIQPDETGTGGLTGDGA